MQIVVQDSRLPNLDLNDANMIFFNATPPPPPQMPNPPFLRVSLHFHFRQEKLLWHGYH